MKKLYLLLILVLLSGCSKEFDKIPEKRNIITVRWLNSSYEEGHILANDLRTKLPTNVTITQCYNPQGNSWLICEER